MAVASHPLMSKTGFPPELATIVLQYAANDSDPSELNQKAIDSLLEQLFRDNQQIFASRDPYGFNERISSQLKEMDPEQPIFMRMRSLYIKLLKLVEDDRYFIPSDLRDLDRGAGPYLLKNYLILEEARAANYERFDASHWRQ